MKRSKNFEKRKKFIMELLGDPLYKPMRLREIASLLQLDKSEKKELFDVLDELCAQGKAEVDNKGRYSKVSGKRRDRRKNKEALKAEKPERGRKGRERREKNHEEYRFSEKDGTLMEGTFIGHYKGFGFVEVEDQEQDIFIPENDTGSAMHQDKVQILVRNGHKEGKRQEGVVLKVLERGMPSIVGTYQSSRDYGFVISDNPKFSKDIFISRKNSMGAKDGDKVVAEITDYGSRNRKPEGKITEVLGNLRSPGTDILAIVKSFNIPSVFPDKVLRQADRVPDHVQEADLDGRLDLRDLVTVTIDGEDAKDLDDAISLTKEDGIYHLGVHIADVSNYVQGGSALDREALKRGTSVYLADRVIPMLPERLSNGICSLNQGQDRLTLSCLMDVNEKGKVISHKIAETVIRVDERMCYTDVKNILEDTDDVVKKRYEALIPMFFLMKELSGILRSRRHTRGSIDFDFPESKIILNAAGRAIDVQPYEANVATRIIEDFMLLANETVAQEYCTGDYPFVYRTHENPDPEKIESLLMLLHNEGVNIQKSGQEITPGEIQEILESIEGMPNEAQISRLTLRTMKQAKYTTECSGHFGLAAKYYCHFTSPIRRYPDLQIHRIIHDRQKRQLAEETFILLFVRKCDPYIKACCCISVIVLLALLHIINSLVVGSQCEFTIYKITSPGLITVIAIISGRTDINCRNRGVHLIGKYNTGSGLTLGSHYVLDICCFIRRGLHLHHIRFRSFRYRRGCRCLHLLLRCHRVLLSATGCKHARCKNSGKNQITFFHYISSI